MALTLDPIELLQYHHCRTIFGWRQTLSFSNTAGHGQLLP